ncbi:MAG: DUF3833 family protein [Hyphomicrobiales bacterium]
MLRTNRDSTFLNIFPARLAPGGIFEDRFGALRRQFTVEVIGAIDGDILKLEEDFLYKDGGEGSPHMENPPDRRA